MSTRLWVLLFLISTVLAGQGQATEGVSTGTENAKAVAPSKAKRGISIRRSRGTVRVDSGIWSVQDVRAESYSKATLPSSCTAGALARVSNSVRGLWVCTGNAWHQITDGRINVKDFGAKGDAKKILGRDTTGSIASSQVRLTTADSVFAAYMVNRPIVVRGAGAGGTNLVTTIAAYVSGTQVDLADAAGVSVSAANVYFGVSEHGASIATGSKNLTSLTPEFAAADVGKVIRISGAGSAGAELRTTIATYTSATQVVLSSAAGATVNGATFLMGADDTAPIQNALNVLVAGLGKLPGNFIITLPAGGYIIRDTLAPANSASYFTFEGAGRNQTTLWWDGSAGIPMFKCINCRWVNFRDFAMFGSSINNPSAGIQMHEQWAGKVGSGAVTWAIFERVFVGNWYGEAIDIGIRFTSAAGPTSGLDTNNEFAVLQDVELYGSTFGVSFESGNSEWHQIRGGNIYGGVAAINTLPSFQTAPGAPRAVLAGPGVGNVNAGSHLYAVTYVTASGETELGLCSEWVTTTAADGQVSLSAIPTGPTGVTARRIYRSKANTEGPLYILATLSDNTTTTLTDNTADENLGAGGPGLIGSNFAAYGTALGAGSGGALLRLGDAYHASTCVACRAEHANAPGDAGVRLIETPRPVQNGPGVQFIGGTFWLGDGMAGVSVSDAATIQYSRVVTSTTANFAASDVGKHIKVTGAGPSGTTLHSVIESFQSPTQVTMRDYASASLTGASLTFRQAYTIWWHGVDGTLAFRDVALTTPGGASLFFPARPINYRGLSGARPLATISGGAWTIASLTFNHPVEIDGVNGWGNWTLINIHTGQARVSRSTNSLAEPRHLSDGDTSPSVAGYSQYEVANGSPTTITDLKDGYVGQEITIHTSNGNTTFQHGGTIRLLGGVNKTLRAGGVIKFRRESDWFANNWYEVNSGPAFLTATAPLDFAAWAGNDCQTLTLTILGAADGDSVALGLPNTLASVPGVVWSGWVSATDTVSVRGCKATSGPSPDPTPATVRADVWKQ